MRATRVELVCVLIVLGLLTACGSMAPMPESFGEKSDPPRPGNWSLHYSGGCTGQEPESLRFIRIAELEIEFESAAQRNTASLEGERPDTFGLLRDAEGRYIGSADFIAPMPVDGRDIVYTIAYDLVATDSGGFVGTETFIEGGGQSIACPVELSYVGEG